MGSTTNLEPEVTALVGLMDVPALPLYNLRVHEQPSKRSSVSLKILNTTLQTLILIEVLVLLIILILVMFYHMLKSIFSP